MDYQLGPGPLQVDQNTIDEKIKGDIGIVENGDVATHAITSGYYVIWKGDLYIAKTDISSGTTLSAASNGNLTAKPNGLGAEVAALNSNLNAFSVVNFEPVSGITSDLFIRRYGRIVCVNGYLTANTAFSSNQLVGYIQARHRPDAPLRCPASVAEYAYSVGDVAYIAINGDGAVRITTRAGNTYKVCYFTASYVVLS